MLYPTVVPREQFLSSATLNNNNSSYQSFNSNISRKTKKYLNFFDFLLIFKACYLDQALWNLFFNSLKKVCVFIDFVFLSREREYIFFHYMI